MNDDLATCGYCGLTWNDAIPTSWTPAPSGRCPFEYEHHADGTPTHPDEIPADFPVRPIDHNPRAVSPTATNTKETTNMIEPTPTTETVTLFAVETLPEIIDVAEIAEEACNAAFKVIADRLTDATGAETPGDFTPGETFALDHVFALFVHAMASNNSALLVHPSRWMIGDVDPAQQITVTVEAMEPDALTLAPGVAITLTGETGQMGALVRLAGSAADVATMLYEQWGNDDEWLRATITEAAAE